jgi:ankyrin repeat protein
MEDLDPEDRCDVEDIMRFCRSLFRYSAKGNLESAHFTVVEFFAGQRLERHNTLKHFWTPRHVALRYIANTCLRYLILDAFREAAPESERERHEFEVQYPFYKIASHRWCPNQVADPAFLEVDQTTTELLQTLFHPKKTPNFTRWAFEYMQATHYRVPEMETHHSISPLHLAVVIGLSLTVKWIMSLDPAAVDLVSSYYGSALHWAILGHVSVVMALMRAISFEEACDLTYRSLHTPEEIVMLLLRSSPDLSARFPMAHSIPGPSAAEMLLYKRLTFGIPILHARQHQFSASSLKYLEVMISHGRGHDHGSICQFMDATLFQPDAHADAALLRLALSQPESGYSDKFAGVDVNKMLSKAIVGDRVDVVDEIIRARPDAIRHHCAPGRGTALHTAAVNGSARCMERILSFGISAQLVDEKQSTALHICARRETLCAEILLKHGCDPLSEDDMGQTVYHVAAASNNHHLLSILLDKSDHSTNSTVFLIEDAARRTPLLAAVEQGADDAVATLLPFAPQVVSQHLATQLVASAARYCSPSNLEAVLELYDHSCPNEPLPPYLIHGLCSSPRCTVQGIKKIMSKSDATLQFDDEGESPLHAYLSVPPEASSIGRTSAETQVIAKLLACEEIINGLDRRGQSVVDLLLARNDLDHPARTVIIADFLLAGLNPHLALSAICANSEACKWLGELEDLLNPVFDRIDQLEMSKHAVFATFALLRSPHTHHLLLRLLDKGLDVDWICDNGYSLCEQAAIVVPSFVVFSNFLQKSRRTTAPNKDGNLMTHVLCSQKSAIGATTHLRALLDAGIDPNAVSTHGSTALIEAISHDNDEFVHLLLERGAKLDLRGQTTKEGWHNERMYPLHWATALGSVQSMRMLLVHCADFGGVLDFSDADMFEIDGVRFGGLKVLHLAVFYGQRLIIQLLLERPYVDVNDLAEGKHTALHLAAVDRNPDIVWYLLVKGASTALQDRSGNTALHLAAMAGDWNIGQRLVDAGSPQTLDHNGLNPLSLAIASKHESFAEALSAWNLKTSKMLHPVYFRSMC